jgi:hypothetical protein
MVHKIDLELEGLEFTDLLNALTDAAVYYRATNGTPNHSLYWGNPERLMTLRDKIDKDAIRNHPTPVGIIGEDGVERPHPYWTETHPGETYIPYGG